MLIKLLKYDLKWIYKVVGVFYILSIIFSIIGRILSNIENSLVFGIITQITFGLAIGMMIASLINCIMRLWARFIKNIYRDEAYLTQTLPVDKKTIYASKVISAIITIFTTAAIIIISLGICYYSETNIEILKQLLEIAASTYNMTVLGILLLVSIVITLQILLIVLIGYVGIIIGHKSNAQKIAKSIILGFALYMITQVISLIFVYIFGLLNPNIMNLINTTEIINIDAIKFIMYAAIGLYALYVLVYYIIGKKVLEKGVNVD